METAAKTESEDLGLMPGQKHLPSSFGQPAQFDLSPRTLDEAMRFADLLANSDIIPKDFQKKSGNILVAIQWGMELGLKPMQAMQNIAVINGRPSLWGDAVIALVRNSPLCEYVRETMNEDGTAVCRVKRKGDEEQVRTFGDADAKLAGLAGKSGPWTNYPRRMKQMRARAFALRDVFADVLKGIPIAEEVMDFDPAPAAVHRTAERVYDPYPDEDFKRWLPNWKKAIRAKKTTADDLALKVKSKGEFTEKQMQQLRDVENSITETATEEANTDENS